MQEDYRREAVREIAIASLFLLVPIVLTIVLQAKQLLSLGMIILLIIMSLPLFSAIITRFTLLRVGQQPEVYQKYMGLPIARFKQEKETNTDNGHFAFDYDQRMDIVRDYHQARANGEVKNKEAWATNRGISGKTLRNYEKEYRRTVKPETTGNK